MATIGRLRRATAVLAVLVVACTASQAAPPEAAPPSAADPAVTGQAAPPSAAQPVAGSPRPAAPPSVAGPSVPASVDGAGSPRTPAPPAASSQQAVVGPPPPPVVAHALEPAEEDGVELQVVDAGIVAQVTGRDSSNRTDRRWGVFGTDLGHTFEHGGRVYMVFGDTWGSDGAEGRQWRSNVMARVGAVDPQSGVTLDDMVVDASGRAKELLASRKVGGDEKTVIPTNGISTGDRMVLHYMSVREWGPPGRWELNHSGLASSADDGRTWQVHPEVRWPASSGFGQVAMVESAGQVYLFGIPGGRFGGVRLARVAAVDLLTPGAHTYWDGSGWVADESAAVTIVPAPVGELSVAWSEHWQRYLMLYLNEERAAIVLRTAPELQGPWDGERVVMTAADHPALYAPYLLAGTDPGRDVLFTMSKFGPYQVFLARLTLEAVGG